MKHILLLGATGTFGTELTKKLIHQEKYRLTLFSRHASSVYKDSGNISVIDGDALSIADLQKAIKATIPSLINFAIQIIRGEKAEYLRESVSITKNMGKEI